MSVLVFRYVQFICIAALFDNVQCDQFLPANSSDYLQLLLTTGCTAKCLGLNTMQPIDECYYECDASIKSSMNTAIQSNDHRYADQHLLRPTLLPVSFTYVKQVCRSDKSMVLDVNFSQFVFDTEESSNIMAKMTQKPPPIYLYHFHETDNILGKHTIAISTESMVHVADLKPATAYNVSVTMINADLEYSIISNNHQLWYTLSDKTVPGVVQNITIGDYAAHEIEGEETKLNVMVFWEPSEDNTCFYKLLTVLETDSKNNFHPIQNEISNPEQLHSFNLTNLSFGGITQISVKSIINGNERDDDYWVMLRVPTCLAFYKNNTDICPPDVPMNLKVNTILTELQTYQFAVTWETPNIMPNYYTIVVSDNKNTSYKFNITGSVNEIVLQPLRLAGIPVVRLYAFTNGGHSMAINSINLKEPYENIAKSYDLLQKSFFYGSLIVLLVFFCFAGRFIWIEKKRRENCADRYQDNIKHANLSDAESNFTCKQTLLAQIYELQKYVDASSFYHEMEVDAASIDLDRVIGQGAFGLVRRAILKTDGRVVAVKTLRESPSVEQMKSFFGEIEVMKSVRRHPNIVGIIGHYTKNVRQMMLLTEYCDEGSMLKFLQKVFNQVNRINKDANCHPFKTSTPKGQLAVCGKPTSSNETKLAECAFNFDTYSNGKSFCVGDKVNIDESNTENDLEYDCPPTYHALDVTTRNGSPPPALKPRSVVVNRMYDENPQGVHNPVDSFVASCNSSCKCQVDIVSSSDADDSGFMSDFHRRSTIRIRDCDCSAKDEETNNNNERNPNHNIHHKTAANKHLPLMVANPGYMMTNSNLRGNQSVKAPVNLPPLFEVKPDHIAIGSQDLLSFANQIAIGMEFLSLNKVVHRDLAARNVLVCSDKTVKIADFGLSRDVYQDNFYEKLGEGKLPIKWMAIESLLRSIYTSQSDVWSFGILLYEIVTLGRTPYPHIQRSEDIIKFLQAEYRMDQPTTCSEDMYELMRSCWESDPEKRPTFGRINERFQEIIYAANKTGEEHIRLKKYSGCEEQLGFSDESTGPTVLLIATNAQDESEISYLTPISS